MEPNDYQDAAMRTQCPQEVVIERLQKNPELIALLHSCIGLAGEVGELATAIQRWLWYGKEDFDKVNGIEEFGDVTWYTAEGIAALGGTLENVMLKNIAKLANRYPRKFTEYLAAEENRDRASEREILERIAGLEGDNTGGLPYVRSQQYIEAANKACVERDAAVAFKVYVHNALDNYGVPDFKAESADGSCRIGKRFHWLFGRYVALEDVLSRAFSALQANYEAQGKKDNYTNNEVSMQLNGARDLILRIKAASQQATPGST